MLGESIAKLRKRKGIKQVDLAKMADIAPETLNRIEKGRVPSWDTIESLCRAMRVTVRELLDVEDEGLSPEEREKHEAFVREGRELFLRTPPAPEAPATVEERLSRIEGRLDALFTLVETRLPAIAPPPVQDDW